MPGGIKNAIRPAKARLKKYIEVKDFALGQPQENEQVEVYHAEKAKFQKIIIKQMEGTA